MKTKHTQGKWTLRVSGYKDYIAIDTNGIANTENRSIFYKPFNPESPHFNEAYYEEWKANAKLIAAAPELLESLQELCTTISQINKHAKDALIERDVQRWEKAEQTIKKATS